MTRRAIAFRLAMLACGMAVGGGLLWVALDSIDWPLARRAFTAADSGWIAIGIAAFALDLALRSWRWYGLVRTLGNIGYMAVGKTLIVGYAINYVVPARLGELYRADRLARIADFSRSAGLATIFVERLLDLLLVVVLLAAGFVAINRPSTTLGATLGVAAMIVLLALALLAAGIWFARSPLSSALLERSASQTSLHRNALRRVLGWITSFSQTLRILSKSAIAGAACLSLPIWLVEGFAIMAILQSVGIEVGVAGLMLTIGAASLSTLIPSAPGFLGSYQIAYIVALGLVDIDATSAAVAATCVMVYLIGSVTILGLSLLAGSAMRQILAREAT